MNRISHITPGLGLTSSGRFRRTLIFLGVYLTTMLLFRVSLGAEAETNGREMAYLRCFGQLGERGGSETYTLRYRATDASPEESAASLFEKFAGGFSSNSGHGFIQIPAGHYQFRISNDSRGGGETVSLELEPGASYTLLATEKDGNGRLRLFKEFPREAEQGPVATIYHLLGEVPLLAQVGDGAQPIRISSSVPFQISEEVLRSKPLSLIYSSERGRQRTREIPSFGDDGTIAVFLRNGYGQSSVVVFPAKPDIEVESTPAVAAGTGNESRSVTP